MNNSCPSCGAIYNVAAKDIGRKIKCKKCSSALIVTDRGLEEDDGRPPADSRSAPAPAPARGTPPEDDYAEEDQPVVRKKKEPRVSGPGVNPLAALNAIGGITTILFGFGVFLVIVFTSLPIIGAAGTDRAAAYTDRLNNERDSKKLEKMKGKKLSEMSESAREDLKKEHDKIDEDYNRKIDEAKIDAQATKIANRRDVWMEQYGLMFGFIFVSFGCIGYLRTEQALVLKITAAVILAVMMIVMFGKFGGCQLR